MNIQTNTIIEKVERTTGAKFDGYGNPELTTAATEVHARFERRSRVVKGSDGDTVTIDASVMVQGIELLLGDILTIRNGRTPARVFRVLSVSEAPRIGGDVDIRSYDLVERRKIAR